MKTETPISDGACVGASWIIASHSNGDFVPLEVARKLELELYALRICFAEASQQASNNGRKQYLEEGWLYPLHKQKLEQQCETLKKDKQLLLDALKSLIPKEQLEAIARYQEAKDFVRKHFNL